MSAYEAGHELNIQAILQHELMPVPVSVTEMNQTLGTGSKSFLTEVLIQKVKYLESGTLQRQNALVINCLALVAAIGKPEKAKTFYDIANAFVGAV